MNILLIIILITYQIIEAIYSVKEIKKLNEEKITEKIRVKFYCETIIYGWIPVVIIAIFVILKSLTLNDIGLRVIKLSSYTWLNVITIIIISALSLLLIYQIIMFIISKKYREEIALQINKNNKKNNNNYDHIINDIMMPKTIKEKIWFAFVSLTAGICEEIAWRGTFIFLMQSIFPTLEIVLIIIISSVLFGIFHSYQGIKGVIKTALVGMLFSILYIICDSLILGIILHFLVDFSLAFILTDKKQN